MAGSVIAPTDHLYSKLVLPQYLWLPPYYRDTLDLILDGHGHPAHLVKSLPKYIVQNGKEDFSISSPVYHFLGKGGGIRRHPSHLVATPPKFKMGEEAIQQKSILISFVILSLE